MHLLRSGRSIAAARQTRAQLNLSMADAHVHSYRRLKRDSKQGRQLLGTAETQWLRHFGNTQLQHDIDDNARKRHAFKAHK